MGQLDIPTVREVMTRSVVTLRPEMAAADAAALLLRHSISGAPVLDADGTLVGMLSELDCLRVVAVSGYEKNAYDLSETVAQLMSTTLHTVAPDLDLFGLTQEFMRLRKRRLPVVDNGRLVGQVSRRDALRAVLTLRQAPQKTALRYPDYPRGRNPIAHYPRR